MKIAALLTRMCIAPKARDSLGRHPRYARFIGHVREHEMRSTARLRDPLSRVAAARLVALGDHDGSAFLGKQLGGGAADPRTRTGDDRDFPAQPVHDIVLALGPDAALVTVERSDYHSSAKELHDG